MPDDVEKNLAFCSVEDFDEISDALLPDVERMLAGGSGHDVFPVPTEATFLPQGFVDKILFRSGEYTSVSVALKLSLNLRDGKQT